MQEFYNSLLKFKAFDLSSITTAKPVVTSSTTKMPSFIVVIRDSKDSQNLLIYSLAFGIPALVVLVSLVFFVYRYKNIHLK